MLSVVLLIIGVQYCMNVVFVVLLVIGLQYCMNVVCSSLDYSCTIQYCTSIIKRTTKTTFIQYCTPIIKRTTDNIHTILYTYNQENYRQHCMNVVCSSLDYSCTILYECCLCCFLDYRCTILYECCL
jgi:hypothetical protein